MGECLLGSFIEYVSKFFRKTVCLPPDTHMLRTRTCAYQGVRNARFSENVAYVLKMNDPFTD